MGIELVDPPHYGRHARGAKCDRIYTKDHHGREGHGLGEGGHARTRNLTLAVASRLCGCS